MATAEDFAQDIINFIDEIRAMPKPLEVLTSLLLEAHNNLPYADTLAREILLKLDGEDPRGALLAKRNAALFAPLVTVYGGPAESELSRILWGKDFAQSGRYDRTRYRELQECLHYKKNESDVEKWWEAQGREYAQTRPKPSEDKPDRSHLKTPKDLEPLPW